MNKRSTVNHPITTLTSHSVVYMKASIILFTESLRMKKSHKLSNKEEKLEND